MKKVSLQSQAGATLIVTLMVVLIVSFIAVIAFRKSNTDLTVSTTAQVENVIFQASDMGMSMLEDQARNNIMGTSIIPYLNTKGTSNGRIGNEITLCVKPKDSTFFSTSKISEKSAFGGTVGSLENGYCDPTQNNFISDRKVTMVQMTIEKRKPQIKGEVLSLENKLSSLGGAPIEGVDTYLKPTAFRVTSTAVLPAFSSASLDDIKDCMELKAKEGADDTYTNHCLTAKKVPLKTTDQGYVYRVLEGL